MGLSRGIEKCGLLMHASIPTTCIPLVFLCVLFFFFSFFFSFLSFLSFYLSFLPFLLPFTVHSYPFFRLSAMVGFTIFAYQLFWLLMGVFLGLSTNLPATQPLPLLKVCWLHHSPFSDKITCLVSYLPPFFTSHI